MAVALQSTAPQTFNVGNSASSSQSVTVDAAGSNRCLVVRLGGEGDGTATQAQVSAMTYNGVAMTQLTRVERSDWSWVEVWRLINPATGANTLAITLSEADDWTWSTLVAQGVDQTTPLRTAATNSGSGTSASATVASVASGEVVFDILVVDGGGKTLNEGANQTEQFDNSPGLGGCDVGASTQAGADGGAMTYSWTGSSPFSYIASSFIAAGGGGSTVERSAAVAATGAVTVAAREFFTIFERSSVVAATGAVASVPQRERLRSATVSATATIASVPQRERLRSATVSATGTVTVADQERDHLRQAAASATGTITSSGEIEGVATEHERTASVAATGAVTAAHQRELQRSSALAATATDTVADYERDRLRQAALAATAAISTSGEVDGVIVRSALVTGTTAVATAYQRELLRQSTVTATALIATRPQRDLLRQSAITGTAAITAAGFVGEQLEYPLNLEHTEPARHATHSEHGAVTHTETAHLTASA